MAKTSAVLKKPSAGGSRKLKKPATKDMKRPAALGLPVKSKKKKEEEEETGEAQEEEVATEDPEEGSQEESEKEAEAEPEESKPKVELSEKALKDWDLFVAEVQKKKPSEKDFEKALGNLNTKQTQLLWKKFEASRKATGQEEAFKDLTQGVGQVSRKRELLRSWALDGGKTLKHFKSTCQEFKLMKESSVSGTWLSYKQTVDAIGEVELKARVQAGTIQARRKKEDSRFWEFKLLQEQEKVKTNQTTGSRIDSSTQAAEKDLLAWNKLAGSGEALVEEDFNLEASSSSAGQAAGVDSGLASFVGLKTQKEEKEKDEKDKKASKWEKESRISEDASQGTMEKQLLKFKGEVQKEQLELETLQLEVKECSMEQKKKATLLKELKGLSNQASMAGQDLQKALNKKGQKKLKAEQVSHVLKESLATLTACKNSKAGAKKQLKAHKATEEEED